MVACAFHRLRRSAVVMVQPTQHRNGDHLVRIVWERSKRQQRVWNPLPKALMRSSLVKVHDIRFEKVMKLLLLEDQVVIQAFSPHASQKAFVIWHLRAAFGTVFEAS